MNGNVFRALVSAGRAFLGRGEGVPNGHAIHVSEEEFFADLSPYLQGSMRRQTIVHDESGNVVLVVGATGMDLFPEPEDETDLPIPAGTPENDEVVSWLR